MLIKLSSSENNRRVGRTFVMDTNNCSTTEGQLITLLYDNAFLIIIRYCIKLNQICGKVILQTQRRSTVYLHSNNQCHQTCQSWAAKLYNLPAVNYHFFFQTEVGSSFGYLLISQLNFADTIQFLISRPMACQFPIIKLVWVI